MKHQMGVQSTTMTRPIGQPGRVRTALRKTVLRPFPCTILAATGIFGGLSALFAGLVCIIFHALIPGDVMFSRVGTVLLVVAIPMILVGSIFLDEIDKNKC